ncbi:MAG: replication initiator protein [Microviridae sp.]|nr:MAG: replication initiator protein [Microviridae sp.]
MQCMQPFNLKLVEQGKTVPVPCGKCPACYKRRVSAWSFRLMQQERIAETSYFITLTYDTRAVPITNSGYMGLQKKDVQLFLKRVRKVHSGSSVSYIKYYCVGEYGGKSYRPHYHIIIFNLQLELMYSRDDLKLLDYSDYDGQVQVKCLQWPHGMTTVGRVTGASVGYTLKYMSKVSKIPMHKNDDRLKEFALMSKGLGVNYLTEQIIQWHKDAPDERMYVPLLDGKKASMPRYYKNKLYTKNELALVNEKVSANIEKQLQQSKTKTTYKEAKAAVDAAFRKMEITHNQNRSL